VLIAKVVEFQNFVSCTQTMMVMTSREASCAQGLRCLALRQTSEYALLAMTLVAEAAAGRPVSALTLARSTGVPKHYLSKVLRRLVDASLLTARRGHGGGFSLARPARLICFADIIDAVERSAAGERCVLGWSDCNGANPCSLHPAFSRLNASVLEWLEATTLEDARRG